MVTADCNVFSGHAHCPYELSAQIGAGGMGEVYRATDTNLKRSVAIKVLPEAVAKDATRLTRFQREAEILAALNHPHIAQIYGLEKSAGMTALVMELVEGPTLAQRIARGALAIDEVLAMAKQIAGALKRHTNKASSTATSNPPTSKSVKTARQRYWTLDWPSRWNRRVWSRRPRRNRRRSWRPQ
jgi:serine/threonine protein kinase